MAFVCCFQLLCCDDLLLYHKNVNTVSCLNHSLAVAVAGPITIGIFHWIYVFLFSKSKVTLCVIFITESIFILLNVTVILSHKITRAVNRNKYYIFVLCWGALCSWHPKIQITALGSGIYFSLFFRQFKRLISRLPPWTVSEKMPASINYHQGAFEAGTEGTTLKGRCWNRAHSLWLSHDIFGFCTHSDTYGTNRLT